MLDSGQVCARPASWKPSDEQAAAAHGLAPGSQRVDTVDALLDLHLDGLVIATPSALHAEQARAARSTAASRCSARNHWAGTRRKRPASWRRRRGRTACWASTCPTGTSPACAGPRLGGHGRTRPHLRRRPGVSYAYGPDKPWFYDPRQSGGGCVVDLGVHLVDLALWTLGFRTWTRCRRSSSPAGTGLADRPGQVEDHAVATLELATGTGVQLACSWRLHAGRDAIISAAFHGTEGRRRPAQRGRLVLRTLRRAVCRHRHPHHGGAARRVGRPGGGGVGDPAGCRRRGSDAAAWRYVDVARVLDRIYGGRGRRRRGSSRRPSRPVRPGGKAAGTDTMVSHCAPPSSANPPGASAAARSGRQGRRPNGRPWCPP